MTAPIIVIVGPTAIGKTKLSVEIAKRLSGVVVSGDAFQLYKRLDIATAKATVQERQGIEHRLIDLIEPDEDISAVRYQRLVRDELAWFQKEKIPVVFAGGSGLYVQSVLFDYRFPGKSRNDAFEQAHDPLSNEDLFALLKEKDPNRAMAIEPENRRRLLRALQIATDSDSDSDRGETKNIAMYPEAIMIGLEAPRELLYERINRRVDQMISAGLVEEAKLVFDRYRQSQAAAAIGYKELFPFFEGTATLESCVEMIKLHSRRYAKRQLTWFKNQMNVHWFVVDFEHFDTTVEDVFQFFIKKTTAGL